MNKMERLVSQGTSGRWILTVLAGWAFFGFCIALGYVSFSLASNSRSLQRLFQ